MQGVINSFDPGTGDGSILCDTDFAEYEFAPGALAASDFRMLRQGQRVVFDVSEQGFAEGLRFGSEVDMGTPGFHEIVPSADPVADEL